MKKLVLTMFCASVFVVACSNGDESSSQSSKPKETVFDPMVDAIDRAKRVEQFTTDRKQQLDQQLEEDEKGAAPRNESR